MTLAQLNDAELHALVAALWHLSGLDGTLSAEEIEGFAVLGAEVGPRRFYVVLDEVRAADPDAAALDATLNAVQRQPARELLYATLNDLAATDGISSDEAAFLASIRQLWGVAALEPMHLVIDADLIERGGA